MASITKRYRTSKGEKVFDSWGIRSSKITGKEIVFHAPATRYEESDVAKRREILEEIEIAIARGRSYCDAIEEIRALGDSRFVAWLVKHGIVNAVRVLSFRELLEEAVEGIKKRGDKPQTIESIKRDAMRFQKYLDEHGMNPPIVQIDKDMARDFWDWICQCDRSEGRKPATTNKVLSNVQKIFKWAYKNLDYIKTNPFNCLRPLSVEYGYDNTTLSEEQISEILDVLKQSENSTMWTAWFLLGVRQGLRLFSEAPLLKWAFVDFESNQIMVIDEKASRRGERRVRYMPLLPQTAEALHRLQEEQKETKQKANGYIFPELWKTVGVLPYSRSTIDVRFQKILKPYGLNYKGTAGVLRRTAANWWRDAVGEYWENMFLGHSLDVARLHYYDPFNIPASIMARIRATDSSADFD